MLEFEENRPKENRRPRVAAALLLLVVAAAAAAYVLPRVHRAGEPPAPRPIPRDFDAAALVQASERLLDSGIRHVVADDFISSKLASITQSQLDGPGLDGTAFGFGFVPKDDTAWLVPRESLSAATNLLAREGFFPRVVDGGSCGCFLCPPPLGDDLGLPTPPAVFFDYGEDGGLALRFIPTDEWVRFQLAHLGPLSVERLEPLVTRAPQSLVLLRFLFANTTGRAHNAVLARLREISPIFSEHPVKFGDGPILGGFKVRRGEDGNRLRLFFSCPAGADDVIGRCEATLTFLTNDGSAAATDTFPLDGDTVSVVAYGMGTGAASFFADREITQANAGGHWRFAVSVARISRDGTRTPLKPESDGKALGGRFGAEFDVFDPGDIGN